MTAAAPITDLLDDIEEQSERAMRDHAAALGRGGGFVDRGLPHIIGHWLADGADPDSPGLALRVAAVLLRDAHVSKRDLSTEDAAAEAARLIARENRRRHDPDPCASEDPTDALVAATIEDTGAPFQSKHLDHLATLREYDPAKFESVRAKLKKHGVRVGQLDKLLAERLGEHRGQRPTQADVLIGLSGEVSLFHTPEFAAYADIEIDGHRQTHPVKAKAFRRYLIKQYLEQTGSAPSSEAIQTALGTIEAKAHFDGPERRVYTRVAHVAGRVYIDLGTDDWRTVVVSADGWEIVDRPPVRFRRAAGVQPLPAPIKGGSIAALRAFLNVGDSAFVLIVAWLLTALRGQGPFPVLPFKGEQGSAKSTTCRLLRSLVDPSTAPLRSMPRDEHDFFIAANNTYLLAFDNVSGIPVWASDAICRVATGGGLGTRELYSDTDETIIDVRRPVMLNGIEDIASRADLADRSIIVALEPISEESRREESELWSDFEAIRPAIFGALLTAVAHGLREFPGTRLARLPRMADFARWAVACEGAHSPAGTFEEAYSANRDCAAEEVAEADLVATAIRAEMDRRTVWTVTASSLLASLSEAVGEGGRKQKGWPSTARGLSGQLRRVAPVLRRLGIGVAFNREGQARIRTITLSRMEGRADQPSVSSAPSAQVEFFDDARDDV